jgi:hypothetical protein
MRMALSLLLFIGSSLGSGCLRIGYETTGLAAPDSDASAREDLDGGEAASTSDAGVVPPSGECGEQGDEDTDSDDVCNAHDDCPASPNTDQLDTDHDGAGDACDDDDDGDGQPDALDRCPFDTPDDGDADGVCDHDDRCAGDSDSVDTDEDGIPDGCDADADGDGMSELDVCPFDNPDDSDGDGSCDSVDRCPDYDDANDGDADGIPDGCDPPACGDGVVDFAAGELCEPMSANAACPTTCDDLDACTMDVQMGSAASCNAVCSHETIALPIGGDGCCPPLGNAVSDGDCAPICGNGITEPGEECDGDGRCGTGCVQALPDSLVHRYSFGEAGTTAIDSVGGANGQLVNTSLPGDGLLVLDGEGSNQYVDLPNRLISALTSVTIELWATWQGGAIRQRLFDFGMNNAGEGANTGQGTSYFYVVPRSDMNDTVDFSVNFTPVPNDAAQADYYYQAPPLTAGVRYHIAVTFRDPGAGSSKTASLYVNGVRRATGSIPASANGVSNRLSSIDDRNCWIGRANLAGRPELSGTIEEFRIYNAALSASDITASFNAGPDP